MPYSHLTLLFKDLFPAKHFTMLLFKIIRGLFRKKLTHLVVIVDICESENPNQKKKKQAVLSLLPFGMLDTYIMFKLSSKLFGELFPYVGY